MAKFSYFVVLDAHLLSVYRVWHNAEHCVTKYHSKEHKFANYRHNVCGGISFNLLPVNSFGPLLDDGLLYGTAPSHSADANSRTVLEGTTPDPRLPMHNQNTYFYWTYLIHCLGRRIMIMVVSGDGDGLCI